MLFSIASYEFRYLARSFQTPIIFAIFFAVTFMASFNGDVLFGDGTGSVYVNAPYHVMQTLITLGIFAILITPAIIASSVLRDIDTQFQPILFSTPITKRDYLGGRFIGSFAALLLAFIGAPCGLLIGALLSPAPPELFGPHNPINYAVTFLFYNLPSLLVVAAIIFSVALITRRMIYAYLAALALWILYAIGAEIDLISPALDPFMYQVFEAETLYWTPSERNSKLLNLSGVVGLNRVLWLGFAVLIFGFAYKAFSFRKVAKAPSEKKLHFFSRNEGVKPELLIGDYGSPCWSFRTGLLQLLARLRFEAMAVVVSVPFLIMLALSAVLLFFNLIDLEILYGVDAYPVTRNMIQTIGGTVSVTLIGILVYYSADVVWRDRANGVSDLMDAVPVSNGIFVTSKLAALSIVMLCVIILGIGLAIFVQLLNGYTQFEPGLYLNRGVFYFGIPFICLTVLAVFLQVLSPNRFTGMIAFGLFWLVSIGAAAFGFDHPLLQYGFGGIDAPLSGMNGSGRFIHAGYAMRFYWAAIAAFFIFLTFLFWNRGTRQPLSIRLRRLHQLRRLTMGVPAALLLFLCVVSGAFIFYNTNIMNTYVSLNDQLTQRAEYERLYSTHAELPMPRTISVKADVEIYPEEGRINSRAVQILENKTDHVISEVHVVFAPNVQVDRVELAGATLVEFNKKYTSYYTFSLPDLMKPGETLILSYDTFIQPVGFPSTSPDTDLVRNGTFVTNRRIAPHIGFDPEYLIRDAAVRAEMDLPFLPFKPKLEDTTEYTNNADRQDSDYIAFETTVSTSASQTAVAPGKLMKEWVADDRRYFHYKTRQPIRNMYGYHSGKYKISRHKWREIDVEIHHQKTDNANVKLLADSVDDSLAYFAEAFGISPFSQVRIIEIPAYHGLARAFPGNIAMSENGSFNAQVSDDEINLPLYITAHEVAHFWWGHQLLPANVEGAPMLAETFAQYSALMVMEQEFGKDSVRKFLAHERENYFSGRADARTDEVPLFRSSNQDYVFYHKGALVMYALKEAVGEDVVNRSLRRLLDLHGNQSSRYATSNDFLDILKSEVGPEHLALIEDLFEKITLYDVSAIDASVSQTQSGRFKTTVGVAASKFYADTEGKEIEVEFDQLIDIGIFRRRPSDPDFTETDIIFLQPRRLNTPMSLIEIETDKEPIFVGIDPYQKLLDRNADDNLQSLKSLPPKGR